MTLERIDAPVRAFDITARDGVRLRVYQAGRGYHRWLLPPGAGTPLLCWKYLFEAFKDQMSIVTWDPRGCYDSQAPDDPARLAVENHVEDALSILEHLGWNEGTFVCGGWSMGVQISLELFRRLPGRISSLVLINGAFEHVLQTAFSFPRGRTLLRAALRVMSASSAVVDPLASYLLDRRATIELLKNLGIVTNNEEFFGEVAETFSSLEFGTYFRLMLKMDEHSARPILPEVNVPTLITAGTADRMTPLSTARELHALIRDSELFVIPNGTHYTTMEYPEIINLKLEQFFRRRVFAADWD